MASLVLVIGTRNLSSWSLRPWMLLRHLGLPFEEIEIALDRPDTAAQIARHTPAGRVPVLLHGEVRIWESLAIGEYLCELAGRGWPQSASARAHARAVSAEMHAGFAALRSHWPMQARAAGLPGTPMSPALAADIARIDALWNDCRARYDADGPWLFGQYSLADAMYAPVALRFRTYGARLGAPGAAYLATALADPFLQEWIAAAGTA